ncbi:MAG: prepilin-type N-terminal cleavage/methylation domain-containing protein [Pseudomonadota bacterium]
MTSAIKIPYKYLARAARGFSLIEILAVVAILVILSSFIGNFSINVNRLNIQGLASEFGDKIKVTRSYAIMTGYRTFICASSNLTTCNSSAFTDGLLIGFVDSTGTHKIYADRSEKLIKITGLNPARIDFSPSGFLIQPVTQANVLFCSSYDSKIKGKNVNVLSSGLVGITDANC